MSQKTILLVEDEPLIALDLMAELEAAGYHVLTADNEWEALLLCVRHLPEVAILNFKNETMQDGMALAYLLRTRYLAKVLFITGARPQDLEASEAFYVGHEVLYKPYTLKQLRDFLISCKAY